MPTDQVLFERRGRLGVIVLNRPRNINALTPQMVEAMLAKLGEWAEDDAVRTVLVRAPGNAASAPAATSWRSTGT
jgi:enoyl-CoA hydratase